MNREYLDPDPEHESDDYADVESEPAIYRATQRVNVRQDASLDAPVLRILEAGTRVPVAALTEGWAELATHDKQVVKADYLQLEDDPS